MKCRSLRKRQYDQNNNDEEIQSPNESFRVNYFFVVVDWYHNNFINNRLEQLEVFESSFGFLFDAKLSISLDNDELKKSCTIFKITFFFHKDLSYVDIDDLFSELKVLQMC
jgi:hypothetical protein